jgi:hypothetical protein
MFSLNANAAAQSREKSRMLAYSVQGRFVNAAPASERLEDLVRFKDFSYLH